MHGRAVHRRRLALLAVIGLAPQGKVSRERLIGMLWPESPSDSARHLLSEALYVLRRELGETAFVISGDDIGLNPSIVALDVVDFEAALARKDLATGVEQYRGPFLDGFYIDGAEDFERWVDQHRDRLARAHAQALNQLAEDAERRGDFSNASERWRQLLDGDPFSSRVALRLMRALDGMGEHAAAIRVGESHAALLRSELGAEPDPSILEFAATLRIDPRAGAISRVSTSSEPSDAGTTAPSPESNSDAGVAAPLERPRILESPRLRLALFATAVAILFASTALILRPRGAAAGPPGSINVIVLPLAPGGDPQTSARVERLQQVLISSLAAVPRIWTVDGGRDFGEWGAWRREPLERLLERAKRIGSRYLIRSDLSDDPQAQAAMMAYDVRTGEQVARATAAQAGEPMLGATQRMALEIARAIASRERLPLGESGYLLAATDSPAALSRFLLARDLFRSGNFDEAAAEFSRAIAADSAFLLAYSRLAMTETWNPRWDFAAARRVVDAGLRWRQNAPPIYGRLLDAQRRFVMREGARAIDQFQRLTVDDPDLVDGWFGVAESLFHYRPSLGGSLTEARAAFERIITIDSSIGPAYEHLAEIALRQKDGAAAARYANRVVNAKERDSYQLAVALRFTSGRDRRAALSALDTAQRNTLSNVARLFVDVPTIIDTIGRVLLMPARSPQDRQWGADYRLIASIAEGRCADGLVQWSSTNVDRGFDKWKLAATFAGCGSAATDASALAEAWQRIQHAGGVDLSAPVTETRDPFRALVLDAFCRGDSGTVERVRALLRHLKGAPADVSDPEPLGLERTLDARGAILARDTLRAIALLEDGLVRYPWWVSAWAPLADAAPQREFLVRALLGRGDTSRARRWAMTFRGSPSLGDILYSRTFLPRAMDDGLQRKGGEK